MCAHSVIPIMLVSNIEWHGMAWHSMEAQMMPFKTEGEKQYRQIVEFENDTEIQYELLTVGGLIYNFFYNKKKSEKIK